MENENVVVKQKSNKGLIVSLIILIIMVLGLCSYIVYDKYFMKEETKTNEVKETQTKVKEESKNDNTTVEVKKEEVPITDKSAFILKASSIGGEFIYCYIQDGSLYYYGINKATSNSLIFDDASYSKEDNGYKVKKYEGLTNIKRIKVFNEGTSVNPLLFVITEDGKVYYKDGLSTIDDIKFNQLNDLKDYQVDDLLDYEQPADPETYYKVKLSDGSIKDLKIQH